MEYVTSVPRSSIKNGKIISFGAGILIIDDLLLSTNL
jgi:hypothetical protein